MNIFSTAIQTRPPRLGPRVVVRAAGPHRAAARRTVVNTGDGTGVSTPLYLVFGRPRKISASPSPVASPVVVNSLAGPAIPDSPDIASPPPPMTACSSGSRAFSVVEPPRTDHHCEEGYASVIHPPELRSSIGDYRPAFGHNGKCFLARRFLRIAPDMKS